MDLSKAPRAPFANTIAEVEVPETDLASVNSALARGAYTSKRAQREALEQQKAALEQDATVFDYDGVYDDFLNSRAAKEAQIAEDKKKRKSKYTENLLQQAKLRKLANDRVYERKLLKEQAEEAKLHGDVKDEDRFIGAAYRKQLEERERYEEALKAEAAAEAETDVTRKGMTGFYQNLLTKNIAFGGDIDNATSSFTVGSRDAGILGGEKPELRDKEVGAVAQVDSRLVTEAAEDKRAPEMERSSTVVAKTEPDKSAITERIAERSSAPGLKEEQRAVPVAAEEAEDPQAKAKAKADKIAAARERAMLRKKNKSTSDKTAASY